MFLVVAAMTDYCCPQNAVKPLWPCYSVFKIELTNPASPLSSVYRYTSKFVSRNQEEQDHPGSLRNTVNCISVTMNQYVFISHVEILLKLSQLVPSNFADLTH